MKNFIYILLLLTISTSVSQAERAVDGFKSYTEYRKLGDYRLWTFVVKDSTLGTLVSIVQKQININNRDGFLIEQKLKLDYSKTGTNLYFNIINENYIATNGDYLGDKMLLTINDKTEEIYLQRDGSILKGYITRDKTEVVQNIELGKIRFVVENNYIDQLELYLASQNLTVGTRINDTIFMSQSLIESDIVAIVEDFRNIQLYNKVFDSAFVIEFTYPTLMTAYFTPDKRLVKLEVPSQELKVYQDAVGNPTQSKLAGLKAADKKVANPNQVVVNRSLGKLIFLYSIYMLVGIFCCFFLQKNIFKNSVNYISVLIGALIFVIIPYTQIPLQELLFTKYFIPHVLQAHESALIWGILPALAAGIIQGVLTALTIFLVSNLLYTKKQSVQFGIVIGLGFGLAEAFFLAYGTPSSIYFGINFVERIFLILFHVSAGTLLGYGLKKSASKFVSYLIFTILINSLFRYFPIFAQNKTLTPELLGILLAFISLTLFTMVLLITKKKN